jgi:hypothetical protein
MTVAFAFLNFVTYIFWWNKPLNVSCPIRIVLKEGHSAPEPRSPESVSLGNRLERMFSLTWPDRDEDLQVDLLREKRVPTFYAGRIDKINSSRILMIAEILIAMVFGGIHCIAWSFSFPTHTEQILWRASSIAIISMPFLLAVGIVIVAVADIITHLDLGNANIVIALSFIIYPFARLVLLILSFISLRSLPASAFYTVRWTTFIPHVG